MLIKIDLLSVECLDKIHSCLDLLIQDGQIKPEATLRETYEKYLGIYNIERKDSKMWDMVQHHEIQSLFQWEKQSGIQGIELTHPRSVDDLAVLNSIIRLMAQDDDEISPLQKYTNFKNDISLWYKEMTQWGLSKDEQKILEPIVKSSYGIAESQEKIMKLVQLPECGGFSLTWADKLRKSIAKKNPAQYQELEKEYFQNVEDKHLSKPLCTYVWKVLIAMSRGYSFNASHTLAYSLVALQEMNLAYRWPIIYWNTACLIIDTGGSEDIEGNKSTNYDKLARGISKMRSVGIKISLPDINKSSYTFKPDVENNQVLFGFRGMLSVGEDVINETINKRPYASIKDYYNKVHPNKQAMISLIKGGAFDTMEDRKFAMAWFIWETCDKKKKLTLSNMAGLIKHNLLPENTDEEKTARRVFEFNRYLKKVCADSTKTIYTLDSRALEFLTEMGYDNLIQSDHTMFVKDWNTKYQEWMGVLRDWLNKNQEEILNNLNYSIFMEDWNKYAQGTYSDWEMAALCFYYHPHVLMNVNNERYGFADFAQLPKDPVIEDTYNIRGHTINIFKISRLAGTCIAKDKMHHTISLLTTTGVVNVKFVKDQFAYFDKQISQRNPDGTKTVIEKSWFTRGNLLIVQGIRSGDTFMCKKYSRTPGHRLAKITRVNNDNSLEIQEERAQGDYEDEE